MRILLAALLGAGALLLGAAPAHVSAASARHPAGIVLHHGGPGPVRHTRAVPTTSDPTCGGSDCSGYESAINRYFTDVAHDSGGSNNVYSVDTQYSDGTGPIAYASTFDSTTNVYVDTNQYPASACNDTFDGQHDTTCLTDAQLQQEILTDINANTWPKDTSSPTDLYFIFTPDNVGICFDSGNAVDGNECSTNVFCAYHDDITSVSGHDIAYAVEPDNATIPTGGCDAFQEPNDPGSDPTINTTSHEMNEAITDPWPETSLGWLANDGPGNTPGDEIGDLCAWGFGTTSGADGSEYNQTINGDHYYLQQEYSNADNGCVQHRSGTASSATTGSGPLVYQGGPVMRTNTIYAIYWLPTAPPPPPPPSPPSNTGAPAVSGTTAVGKTLTTSNGSWSNSPTGFSYKWEDCSAGGVSCATISGATSASYKLTSSDAGLRVRSEVSAHNSGGSSGYTASAASDVVVPVPAVTVVPTVSGVPAVGKTLFTSAGTWNTPVTATYEWLRCLGSSCAYIPSAQATSYQITSADAGHTLEARVLATNAAGTTAAVTAPTVAVIDVPKASTLPHITGTAKVGKKLSVANGTWANSPTSFSYQWLRCSAKGGSCAPISGATRASYKLGKKDAKHRLRIQVSAVNAAGTTTSRSAATKTVPAPATAKRRG